MNGNKSKETEDKEKAWAEHTQSAVDETFKIASVAAWILGYGRSSTSI
jgi:hypothetical protein